MNHIIVLNEKELKNAMEQGVSHIIIKGEFAEEFRKKYQKQKRKKITTAAIAAGSILADPFTGGFSLLGLTAGPVIIGIGELALRIGAGLCIYTIRKNYKKIFFNPNGTLELIRE
jgi:hypothetical protein